MKRIISFTLSVLMLASSIPLVVLAGTTGATIADDLSEHLLLYSSFDDENVNDESGKGHNGTVNGTVSYVDGVSGKAVFIDGNQAGTGSGNTDYAATNYISYGASSEIIPDTGDFTVSMMFRFTGDKLPYGAVLLSNKDYTSGKNAGFAVVVGDETSSRSQRMNFGDGSNNKNAKTNASVGDGAWHMLTGTYDRDGNVTLYIDGAVVATDSISAGNGKSITAAGLPLILGADGDKCYGVVDTAVDELCIYDKALSADEIEQLYTYTLCQLMLKRFVHKGELL